jgi:uncharacterized protein
MSRFSALISHRLLRSRRLALLLVVAAGYLLIMTYGRLADRLILFPSTDAIDAAGAERRMVAFGRGEVEVWTARSPGAGDGAPAAYVLEFTGNATRAEWIAAYAAHRWRERAVEVWAVNYPGYGGSTGPASLQLIGSAALAVYDDLAHESRGRPIVVAGTSLGTAAALYVGAERPVSGLILQNPPPLQDLIMRRFGWWNLWLIAGPIARQVPAELNALRTAPRCDAPAVFLLAGRDEIVPPAYQRKVVEAYAGEKRLIQLEDAHHNAPVEGAALQELDEGMDWLLNNAPTRVQ